MTNFVKEQNLQTKIKMNIWTFWMYYIPVAKGRHKRKSI